MNEEDNLAPIETAFLNQVILELLLSFLSLHDILKLRRINWFFKNIGDQIIEERKCPLLFGNLLKLKFDDIKYTIPGVKMINRFIDTLASSKWHLPFHTFEMAVNKYDSKMADLDNRLHHRISEIAKHLEFVCCLHCYGFWRTSDKYPCLESLHFLTYNDFAESNSLVLYGFAEIMQGSPCLEKLVLTLKKATNAESLTKFLSCLKNKHTRSIKHLELTAIFNNEHWTILRGLELRLTTLKITLPDIASHKLETFKSFLETQSETLENLEITLIEVSKLLVLTFPEMKKVVSLLMNFHSLQFPCKRIQFPGLCYATQFPNLKRLLLQGEYKQVFCVDWYLNERMKKSTSVQYLELPAYSDVAMAMKIFPNVMELRCPTINMNSLDALRSVNNLERLTLYKHEHSEWAFETFLQGKLGTGHVPRSEKFGNKLKYLKFVQIKMTDESAQLMIEMVKSLQYLDLWECDEAKISAQCIEEMRKKIKVYIQRRCILFQD